MNRSFNKEARRRRHTDMMKAFYAFLDSLGDLRPMEGEPRYNGMLAAFKAGWEAA